MNEQIETLNLEIEVLKEMLSDDTIERLVNAAFAEVFGGDDVSL